MATDRKGTMQGGMDATPQQVQQLIGQAERVVTHQQYAIFVVPHDGVPALVVTMGQEAHVFVLVDDAAKQVEDGIRRLRTGIVTATEMPGRNGDG